MPTHTPLPRGVGCIIAPRPQRRDGAFLRVVAPTEEGKVKSFTTEHTEPRRKPKNRWDCFQTARAFLRSCGCRVACQTQNSIKTRALWGFFGPKNGPQNDKGHAYRAPIQTVHETG